MSNKKILKNENSTVISQMDLGDDLILEKTKAFPVLTKGDEFLEIQKKVSNNHLEDQLQNAKILVSEGLYFEAKKILRKILIFYPEHLRALELLESIHDFELQHIFNTQQVPHYLQLSQGTDQGSEYHTEKLIEQLEQDLKLDLEDHNYFLKENFWSKDLVDQLKKYKTSPQDWIDLGIGFLEMKLYSVANLLFEELCKQMLDRNLKIDFLYFSLVTLKSYGLILSGLYYEAINSLYILLQDSGLEKERKIEAFYLIGLAYERLGDQKKSFEFYSQTYRIDSKYRNIAVKLKKNNKC